MGKRLLSTLLALALALSLVPAAFAADYRTITLVQETVGDPNEEFVYYILADYYSYMSLEENVELITAGWKRCDCGFMVFSFQPNPDDIWQVFGKENAPASSFSDVPANADYAAAVNWAVANGITNGMGDGLFQPDTVCSRGQIVTFLHRAYVPGARLK